MPAVLLVPSVALLLAWVWARLTRPGMPEGLDPGFGHGAGWGGSAGAGVGVGGGREGEWAGLDRELPAPRGANVRS
jgi:hypothetical protein